MAVELQRSCPVCQATSARPLFHKQGCDFVRCHDCGLTYINPVPAADALAAHYARYGREYFTNREKLRQDFAPQRYGRELAFLRRAGARGRLVDVGCATGSFLAAAQGAGFTSTVGVDIAGPSCAYARSLGLDAREGDFTAGFLDEASADTVAMWATLEHLPDPAAFVAAAGRVLGAGGLLVVSVPNMRSLSQLLLGRRDRYVGADHLNYFDRGTLGRLVERAGFEVTCVETRGINPIVILADLRSATANATQAQQIADGASTLTVKQSPLFAPVRAAHRAVDTALALTGAGDLLMLAARRRSCP